MLPLAAAAGGERRVARVALALRLPRPPRDRGELALLAALPLVLALAATQPVLTRRSAVPVRTDAAVFVVLDVSRSMEASAAPGAPTRLARARTVAIRLRAALPQIPFGVATFTDNLVPLLFPTSDAAAFDSTVRHAVRPEAPPPVEIAPVATNFEALGALGSQGYFTSRERHRAVVVLTDGESEAFDAASVASGLGSTALVVVRFWHPDERVFFKGDAEPDYRPDPASAAIVDQLASATGGRSFGEANVAGVVGALRHDAGRGTTSSGVATARRHPLAPWIALAALLPLAALARRRLLANL